MTYLQKFKLRLFGIKPKDYRVTNNLIDNSVTPKGISSTMVPRSFEKDFKTWDKNLFNNITYID